MYSVVIMFTCEEYSSLKRHRYKVDWLQAGAAAASADPVPTTRCAAGAGGCVKSTHHLLDWASAHHLWVLNPAERQVSGSGVDLGLVLDHGGEKVAETLLGRGGIHRNVGNDGVQLLLRILQTET